MGTENLILCLFVIFLTSRENLIQFERKPLVLREEVIKANTLVREANQLSEEMGKETEFAVTLQVH